jgi:hypothetical protein
MNKLKRKTEQKAIEYKKTISKMGKNRNEIKKN